MNFNKCERCGAFFVSSNSVCPNCEPKDNAELFKLKSFIADNDCPNSIESLATHTGISVKNLNRFLKQEDLETYTSKLDINKIENRRAFPSMQGFFFICEYLGITPEEFFNTNVSSPKKADALMKRIGALNSEQIDHITFIIDDILE